MSTLRDAAIVFAREQRNHFMREARTARIRGPSLTHRSERECVRYAREWNRAKLRLVLGKP